MWKVVVALLLVACAGDRAWAETPSHPIGVLTREGEDDTGERWSATADYLAERVSGHVFVMVPLRQEALSRAVARGEVEFALTSPGHYVELAVLQGMHCLATLQHAWRDMLHSTAGAAILARADRNDIAWMSDLKGKSFMAVSRESFGGFQLAWWELRSHDIDPFRDFSRLVFSGFPAERIVEAVRDGLVDAAAVRTDVLERMVDEGTVNLTAFRVLHPRASAQHPVVRSTDLYPEWAFAAAQGVPEDLVRRVALALQAMPAAHIAAQSGRYAGWTAPLDYQPVHEVLRDLHLPPYDDVVDLTLFEIAHRHWLWLVGASALLVLLIGTTAYTLRRNYWLKASKSALERARTAEAELSHVGRLAAMGEMSTTLAHELNQPLTAIVNYAKGSIRRLEAGNLDKEDLARVLERIAAEGQRSAEIIRGLRDFLRKRKPVHEPADANRLVREAVDLARLKAHHKNVTVRLELGESLPPVVVDVVQIEQVIVNLVHNAIEAIDDARSPRREITIATQRNERKGVDVTVSDTGPGVPEGGVDRLFEPFVSTKHDGMGMGLSISRSIVEAHGDRLRIVAHAAGGAAFRFTLPETEPRS